MRGFIIAYLNKNYSVIEYGTSSNLPPRNGCLLFSKTMKLEISWANFNRNIAQIFSIDLSDAQYITSTWFDFHAKIIHQAKQGFREVQ